MKSQIEWNHGPLALSPRPRTSSNANTGAYLGSSELKINDYTLQFHYSQKMVLADKLAEGVEGQNLILLEGVISLDEATEQGLLSLSQEESERLVPIVIPRHVEVPKPWSIIPESFP